jgi:hypothetical protein
MASIASQTSPTPIDPKSLPSEPTRAVISTTPRASIACLRLSVFQLRALRLEFRQVFGRCHLGLALRHQVVARKSGLDVDLVTDRAQVFNIFHQDNFHRSTSFQLN